MKVLVNLNLNGNEIQNVVVQVLSSAPSSPVEGQIYYDSTLHQLCFYDGSTWIQLDTPSTDADQLDGQDGTYYLDRSNHTGTQLASTISDFDTQVRTSRLDQMAAPNADVSMNSHKLTNVTDPSSAQDAATKSYVDAIRSGLDVKQSVRVATTGAGTLASSFENGDSIDGVTLATGDRILIKNQASGAENGIYTVNASGAPTRATDADSDAEVTPGMFVFVEEGTTNADSGWVLTTNATITLGSTALTFAQFSGAGQITAGTGLSKSGNTLSLDTASGYGVRKYSADIGDGSTTALVVTHNLGTRDVQVQVYPNASPYDTVFPDVERTTTNTVTIRFATAPSSNAYRVVITG